MYIGNDLQIAHPSYKIIDDISSGFDGSTTSFALQVSGATPVPFPISTQQVMISVNGVVQEPDPTGSAGFKLLGSNIVFSSAPANGHAFFGVINAGADYVTAGSEFPDGSATAPSFTFQDDQDTGWFRSGSGAVGYSANGAQTLTFDGNGLTVTGDASFVGDSAKNLLWDKSDGQLEFADSAKAVFGTDSDAELYHSGSHGYLINSTGNFNLRTGGTLWIDNAAGNETYIKAIENGAVELYHNNVKKFETASDRVNITGHMISTGTVKGTKLSVDDGNKATFGSSDDLEVYHDGSHSYIKNGQGSLKICDTNVELMNAAANEYMLKAIQDGAVQLFHDNVKVFETEDNGAYLYGPEGGIAQLMLYADEGDDNADKWRMATSTSASEFTLFNFNDGAWETSIKAIGSSGVELYRDNVKKLETDGNGINVIDNDSTVEVSLTDSNGAAGHVYGNSSSGLIALLVGNGETSVAGYQNGATQLFHDNSKKLETTSSGVTVTGSVVAGGADFAGLLTEAVTITAGKLSDNTNLNLSGGNVFHFTTTESTTSTPNLRYDGSTTLNSKMSTGDTVSVIIITSAAAAGYSAQLTIDGAAVTEKWSGGAAPSAGSASGYDVYSYTIIKTGSAAWTVLASFSNFA